MKYVVLLMALLPLHVAARDGEAVLLELSKNLAQVRALPVGTKTNYSCPGELDSLIGITQSRVETVLPKQDWPTVDSGNLKFQRSYFLTSPIPEGRRGGGFPEITIYYTERGVIERVTCYYSR